MLFIFFLRKSCDSNYLFGNKNASKQVDCLTCSSSLRRLLESRQPLFSFFFVCVCVRIHNKNENTKIKGKVFWMMKCFKVDRERLAERARVWYLPGRPAQRETVWKVHCVILNRQRNNASTKATRDWDLEEPVKVFLRRATAATLHLFGSLPPPTGSFFTAWFMRRFGFYSYCIL